MDKVTKEEYLASLRRQSSGFSRGVSKYRGVARLVSLLKNITQQLLFILFAIREIVIYEIHLRIF